MSPNTNTYIKLLKQNVTLPSDRTLLVTCWVFDIKSPGKYKARLVAQGFRQKEGIDTKETFAPVIRYESVRIFFVISVHLDLRVHQFDVNTAFLNSDIDTEVFVKQPPGFADPAHHDWV